MLNNKGQSLVLFVLIIPIILIIMVLVVDIGKMVLLKQELNDINYIAIDYAVDMIADDSVDKDIRELIYKNKNDINRVDIKIENEIVYITLEDNVEFLLIGNNDFVTVKSSYLGYIKDGNKIIERDK